MAEQIAAAAVASSSPILRRLGGRGELGFLIRAAGKWSGSRLGGAPGE